VIYKNQSRDIIRLGSIPFRLIPFCAGLGTETLTLTLTLSDVIYNGLGELGLGEMGGHLRLTSVSSLSGKHGVVLIDIFLERYNGVWTVDCGNVEDVDECKMGRSYSPHSGSLQFRLTPFRLIPNPNPNPKTLSPNPKPNGDWGKWD